MGKKAKYTIIYEIGVDPETRLIYWLAGGLLGSENNLAMVKWSGLLNHKEVYKMWLEDCVYWTLKQFTTPCRGKWSDLSAAEKVVTHTISSERETVEHTFGCMKEFCILAERMQND